LAGAQTQIIAPVLGSISGALKGKSFKVDQSFLTATSVVFDAVYVPGGTESIAALSNEPDAIHFINEAYKHCKAIAADAEGGEFLLTTDAGKKIIELSKTTKSKYTGDGIVINGEAEAFISAIAQHRFWAREIPGKVPA
jgi:catalase